MLFLLACDIFSHYTISIYPGIEPSVHYKNQTYKGKVVFITGANRGIGEATALFYARAGATVSIAARDPTLLEGVKAQIVKENPDAQVATWPTDVKNVEQVKTAIEGTVAKFGRLDIAFANAGVADLWVERESPFNVFLDTSSSSSCSFHCD